MASACLSIICARPLPSAMAYCPYCGHAQPRPQPASSPALPPKPSSATIRNAEDEEPQSPFENGEAEVRRGMSGPWQKRPAAVMRGHHGQGLTHQEPERPGDPTRSHFQTGSQNTTEVSASSDETEPTPEILAPPTTGPRLLMVAFWFLVLMVPFTIGLSTILLLIGTSCAKTRVANSIYSQHLPLMVIIGLGCAVAYYSFSQEQFLLLLVFLINLYLGGRGMVRAWRRQPFFGSTGNGDGLPPSSA